MGIDSLTRFISQNINTASDLTPAQLSSIAPFARRLTGDLIVLQGTLADGRLIKLHDAWGSGDQDLIILHTFHPDRPLKSDSVTFYASGRLAVIEFLRAIEQP